MKIKEEEILSQDFFRGIEELDEAILDNIFKTFGPTIAAYAKRKGGTENDSKLVFRKAIQWIAAHLPHHQILYECSFPKLFQNLIDVFWELEVGNQQPNIFLDELNSDAKTCHYNKNRILVEVIILKHYQTMEADCKLALRCLWSGNPFDYWKKELHDMDPDNVKQEKLSCIDQLYSRVVQDPIFIHYYQNKPVLESLDNPDQIKLIEDFWDGVLGGDELKLIADQMEEEVVVKNTAYLIQSMREVIRIPEEKIHNPQALNVLLERMEEKHVKSGLEKLHKGFNFKTSLWLMAIFLVVVMVVVLLFN